MQIRIPSDELYHIGAERRVGHESDSPSENRRLNRPYIVAQKSCLNCIPKREIQGIDNKNERHEKREDEIGKKLRNKPLVLPRIEIDREVRQVGEEEVEYDRQKVCFHRRKQQSKPLLLGWAWKAHRGISWEVPEIRAKLL